MENNNEDNKTPQNKFNFNTYWIYGIIILGLLAFNIMFTLSGKPKEITIGQMETMALNGEIDSMIIVTNTREGFVFVRKDLLTSKYQDIEINRFNHSTRCAISCVQ